MAVGATLRPTPPTAAERRSTPTSSADVAFPSLFITPVPIHGSSFVLSTQLICCSNRTLNDFPVLLNRDAILFCTWPLTTGISAL
eukprot:g44881.t1